MRAPWLSVWPPLPPTIYLRRRSRDRPFPLDDERCRIFARARHALWHGVKAIGLRSGDEVLAPAYHHGSEVEALVQRGLVCRFYEATETLEPDQAELEDLLSPATRALYLIHYLGFPQDAPRWRRWCDEHGLLLLEDAAQAWLATCDGQPVGSFGDLSIFCIYKTFGFPDGGALVCANPPPSVAPASVKAGMIVLRHAAWAVGRSDIAAAAARRMRSPEAINMDEEFALGDPSSAPSSALEFLFPRLVDRHAAAERRALYELLLADLSDMVLPAFAEVHQGASPFAFPLATSQKGELLGRLASNGVYALDFWSEPHPNLPVDDFPAAADLRRRVVGLPVHQELRSSDVERMVRATSTRSTPRQNLEIERLSTLESVRDEWRALAEQTGNIFATWEWNSIWWRHHGRGRPLRAYACRVGDGSVAAILPLYVSTDRPLRLMRFIGHGDSDHLAAICRREHRGPAARALREALSAERVDLFVGETVPAADGWATLLAGKVLSRAGSPVLHFRNREWDSLLARMSHNTRAQVRRRERKLAREHDVRFRLADDRDRLDDDLDTLFSLHAARWHGRGTRFSQSGQAFQREFAHCAFDRGWLRLWLLEVDGAPVSAWYGFRFGGAESYYQAGRDPAWNRLSVGFVLLVHSIRAALEDGAREYRFLEGGEAYKYRFTEDDGGLETIGVSRGALGGAALAALCVAPPLGKIGRRIIG
jgi:dTDP-4-amino-4,6-dideoxygalactose transaminase/CelD/BcsL family acetyltransferase involved in cellulose biosynthesis